MPSAIMRTGLAYCTDPDYVVHFNKPSKCRSCAKSRLKHELHRHGFSQLSVEQSMDEIRDHFPFLKDQSRMWVKIIDGPLSNLGMAAFKTRDGPRARIGKPRVDTFDDVFTSHIPGPFISSMYRLFTKSAFFVTRSY
jgi:hypothetical protein